MRTSIKVCVCVCAFVFEEFQWNAASTLPQAGMVGVLILEIEEEMEG